VKNKRAVEPRLVRIFLFLLFSALAVGADALPVTIINRHGDRTRLGNNAVVHVYTKSQCRLPRELNPIDPII
jgi:hypothetical protein